MSAPSAGHRVAVESNLECIARDGTKGERIRLYVSSSDFPNFDRNHNTGRDYWSDTELRPAHQTIFHSADRPSCLILPVIPR